VQTLLRTAFAAPLLVIAGQIWGQSPGSTGDQQRTYYFAEAGQEIPYLLYVPESYDADAGAPLVVALHGYAGDPDTFFTAVPELPALLEQFGFVFVAPMSTIVCRTSAMSPCMFPSARMRTRHGWRRAGRRSRR
jgi:poly(3-hydroxybutyrate) depolymerase